LTRELGPFEEKDGEWGSISLELPKFGARITAASSEQSIRGIRHGQHRPDLIILDDVEDSNSVKTLEGRDKTYNWLMSEIIPAGDRNTKIVVIGNLLHEDSLLMRLKENMEAGNLDGIYRAYPLINEAGEILWPGKFRNMDEIEELHKTISSEVAWQREIMLRIIPDDGQVIYPEWIQYYDRLPNEKPSYVVVGIDLAIKQKDTADYTAMVSAYVYGSGDNLKVCILPNPINERLTFPKTLEKIRMINDVFSRETKYICVENVAYQEAVLQQLKAEGIRAEGVKVNSVDKRSKLIPTSEYIFSGKVLFPKNGAEDLIQQLVGFGVEKHDDLADAFAFVVLKVIDRNKLGGGCGVLISER
jgi:predicted phage terminase large subunit-like protein